jgi:hypothetical protein
MCFCLHFERMEANIIVMRILMCDPQGNWDAERPIKHFFVFISLFLCFSSLSLHLSLPLFLTYGLAETYIHADDQHWYPRLKQATEGWLPRWCLSHGRAKNNRIGLLYIPAAWRLISENLFVRLTDSLIWPLAISHVTSVDLVTSDHAPWSPTDRNIMNLMFTQHVWLLWQPFSSV